MKLGDAFLTNVHKEYILRTSVQQDRKIIVATLTWC